MFKTFNEFKCFLKFDEFKWFRLVLTSETSQTPQTSETPAERHGKPKQQTTNNKPPKQQPPKSLPNLNPQAICSVHRGSGFDIERAVKFIHICKRSIYSVFGRRVNVCHQSVFFLLFTCMSKPS